MSDDLVAFLRARLDEDEAWVVDGDCPCPEGGLIPNCPERVLREVEAKRRLVGWAETKALYVLTALALPYADHPDYRQEWRP